MASAAVGTGLIDTNILVDALRARPPAMAFVVQQRSAGAAQVSIISAMELVAGCRNATELAQLQQWLLNLNVLPVSAVTSQHALQLMEAYSLSHGLDIPDALIAATALEQGLNLHTLNVRHFQMIPGLTVVKPY